MKFMQNADWEKDLLWCYHWICNKTCKL